MSVNPYAPPTAVVADLASPEVGVETPFFAVSVTKLVIMSVCTFTAYEIYWFYSNWKRIDRREKAGYLVPARALLAPFFCYQCFARIRDYECEGNAESRLAAVPLAIAWIAISVVGVMPAPYGWFSFVSFVFLIPVQVYVNRLNSIATPSHNRNAHFTGWNWFGIVFGGLVLMLVLASTFLPFEPPVVP